MTNICILNSYNENKNEKSLEQTLHKKGLPENTCTYIYTWKAAQQIYSSENASYDHTNIRITKILLVGV